MNSNESQVAGLRMLLSECDDWQAMLLIQRQGDTPFLTGISPRLRGYEIVCYTGEYDVWKGDRIVKADLSLEECRDWLKSRSPSELQFLRNGSRWAEETFKMYRIPERKQ